MEEKTFKVRWGVSVKIFTAIILIALLSSMIVVIRNFLSHDYSSNSLIIFLVLLLICVFSLWESPRLIKINENEILLQKIIGQLVIHIDSIVYIEPYKPDKTDIRLFGIGGIGGFSGIFYNFNLGKYRAYIGDTSQAFLIVTEQRKKYVLSCENRDFAISTIKSFMMHI